MRLIHKGLILVGVPFVGAILLIALMFGLIQHSDQQRLENERQRRVKEIQTKVMMLWCDMSPDLMVLSRSPDDAKANSSERVKRNLAQIRQLHQEALGLNPNLNADPEEISFQKCIGAFTDKLKQMHDLINSRDFSFELGHEMEAIQNSISPLMHRMLQEPHNSVSEKIEQLNAQYRQEQQVWKQAALLSGVGIALSLIAAIGFGLWFLKDIAERLRIITDNTLRLGRHQKLHVPLKGRDEIASLDQSFHVMAAELAEAMRREHALFQNATDIMCIIDGGLEFTAVNPACRLILGYESHEMVGHTLMDFVIESDWPSTLTLFEQVKSGHPSGTLENRLQHKDGRILDLLWSVYWSELDQALYTVAHDISDRKEIERLKENFLGMVSNDLRSPLTAMLDTFKAANGGALGELSDTASDKISEVSANATRMLSLVDDLLAVETMQSGRIGVKRETVDIAGLLKQAAAAVDPLAEAKRITIIDSCEVYHFALDRDRMMQVLVNLLSNAIKFSPEGSTIGVSASREDDNLVVEVTDQGRGVPESQRESIFERFKQVEAADGVRRRGTGLGLPICKQIVNEHGGTIGVRAEAAGGSTFWISIPSSPATATASGSPLPPPIVAAGEPAVRACEASRNAPPPGSPLPQPGDLHSSTFLSNVRIAHKGVVLIIVPLIFELIFTASIFYLFSQAFYEKQNELHQRIVSMTASDLLIQLADAAAALGMDPPDLGWKTLQSVEDGISNTESVLTKITASDRKESTIVRRVVITCIPFHGLVGRSRKLFDTPNVWHGFQDSDWQYCLGLFENDAIRGLIDYADSRGNQSPIKLNELRRAQMIVLGSGLVISLLICALSAAIFSRGIVSRLKIAEDNGRRLVRDEPLNPELSGTDEVAQLDQVFHAIAAALKEARHKERAVFDNAQDVIAVMDVPGKVLQINPACERQWGYEGSALVGRSVFEVIHASSRQAAESAFHEIANGGRPQDIEIVIAKKDGSSSDAIWSLSWSEDAHDVVAIAHDISQRKQLDRLKQEFLSMVSHDMRTPLSAILGTAEMLTMGVYGPLPGQASAAFTEVAENCDRLLGLIDDLLDIEKLEAGQMQLSLHPVAASDVLQRSTESLSELARERAVKVLVETPHDLLVTADSERLVQALMNLLSNAIKCSPSGAEVHLTATEENGYVEFRIGDQGCGIAESDREGLFHRYRQLRNAAGQDSSRGLGLPISWQIARQHGGTIKVESEVGKGSTFSLRIPLNKSES